MAPRLRLAFVPFEVASESISIEIMENEIFAESQRSRMLADSFLSPVLVDERNDPIGPHMSRNGRRCSDEGFLPLTQLEYFEVLDWAARITVANKRGWTLPEAPPVLERLGIDPGIGSKLVQDFGRLFEVVPVPRTGQSLSLD